MSITKNFLVLSLWCLCTRWPSYFRKVYSHIIILLLNSTALSFIVYINLNASVSFFFCLFCAMRISIGSLHLPAHCHLYSEDHGLRYCTKKMLCTDRRVSPVVLIASIKAYKACVIAPLLMGYGSRALYQLSRIFIHKCARFLFLTSTPYIWPPRRFFAWIRDYIHCV